MGVLLQIILFFSANYDPNGSKDGFDEFGGDSHDTRTTTIIIICILVSLIVIGLIVLAVAVTCRRKQKGLTEASPLRPQPGQSFSAPVAENVYLEIIGTPEGSTTGERPTLPGENIYDNPDHPSSEMGDEPDYRKMQEKLKKRNDGNLYPQTGYDDSKSDTLPDPGNEYRDIQQELEGINRGKLYPRVSNVK